MSFYKLNIETDDSTPQNVELERTTEDEDVTFTDLFGAFLDATKALGYSVPHKVAEAFNELEGEF